MIYANQIWLWIQSGNAELPWWRLSKANLYGRLRSSYGFLAIPYTILARKLFNLLGQVAKYTCEAIRSWEMELWTLSKNQSGVTFLWTLLMHDECCELSASHNSSSGSENIMQERIYWVKDFLIYSNVYGQRIRECN